MQSTNRVGLDIAIDELASDWVHGDSTGAVHHAIGDDSLRVDAGQRLGGLVGEHGSLGSHVEGVRRKSEERGTKNEERKKHFYFTTPLLFHGVDIPRTGKRSKRNEGSHVTRRSAEAILTCLGLCGGLILSPRCFPRTVYPARCVGATGAGFAFITHSSLFLFIFFSQELIMSAFSVAQPPYPLHESVRDLLDPEYVAFYNKHVINNQQVHLQPVAASRTSGVLIPGAGPMLEVGKTQDLSIQRRATDGPPVPIRCFTPKGDTPAGGWPVMLYFHGGGWVLGNIDTENVVCSNLCVRGNCVVVTVDYR